MRILDPRSGLWRFAKFAEVDTNYNSPVALEIFSSLLIQTHPHILTQICHERRPVSGVPVVVLQKPQADDHRSDQTDHQFEEAIVQEILGITSQKCEAS